MNKGSGEFMPEDPLFDEKISSVRTEVLFVALAVGFFVLLSWRVLATGAGAIAGILLFISLFFSFYALNYRVLAIRISAGNLEFRFGVFGWRIPLNSIEAVFADETTLWRIGGAGIHFSPIGGRYRAMLNFLEYPRVVVSLKEKRGWIRDVAFSTTRPKEVMHIIQESLDQ